MPTNTPREPPRADQSDLPPLNRAFEAFSPPGRRRILTRLVEAESRAPEGFTPDEFLTESEAPDRHRVELFHLHLSKLDEVGYVGWDRDAVEIRPGPRYDEVQSLVELFLENRETLPGRWH